MTATTALAALTSPSQSPTTPTSSPRLSSKLKELLLSGERRIIGPKTAAELFCWLTEAEAALPPPATNDAIEAAVTMLSLATKEKAVTPADARVRFQLYAMALSDVASTDLDRAVEHLVKTSKFLPTPAEVRTIAMQHAAKRNYALSRARHLLFLHRTEYVAPVPEDQRVTQADFQSLMTKIAVTYPSNR